jgi:hypothetical protein
MASLMQRAALVSDSLRNQTQILRRRVRAAVRHAPRWSPLVETTGRESASRSALQLRSLALCNTLNVLVLSN